MHVHVHNHDEHDLGLAHDLSRLAMTLPNSVGSPVKARALALPVMNRQLERRDFIRLAVISGVAGTLTLGGLRRTANAQATTAACTDINEETAGPYPGDGTNGPNVLTASGVVRKDIRSSFGSLSGTAAGVALTVSLTLTDSASCTPAKGYAVYLWHADQQGRYSLYSSGVTDQNYLRGVQEADANGVVTFNTVFPGCYDGRWPHIHFEVYPSLSAAGDASKRIATSQLALPKAAADAAYTAAGYTASPANLARVSLATDGVFSDDAGSRQVAVVTGSVANGFVATLPVTVSNSVKASGSSGGAPAGGPPAGGPPAGGPPAGGAPGAPGAPATTVAPTTVAAKKATTTKKKATTAKKKATTAKKKSTVKKTTTTVKK